MRVQKLTFLMIILMLILMFTSCFSSGKSRKSGKRYHQRCDCSRFSELTSNEVTTVDWAAHHGRQTDSE